MGKESSADGALCLSWTVHDVLQSLIHVLGHLTLTFDGEPRGEIHGRISD